MTEDEQSAPDRLHEVEFLLPFLQDKYLEGLVTQSKISLGIHPSDCIETSLLAVSIHVITYFVKRVARKRLLVSLSLVVLCVPFHT